MTHSESEEEDNKKEKKIYNATKKQTKEKDRRSDKLTAAMKKKSESKKKERTNETPKDAADRAKFQRDVEALGGSYAAKFLQLNSSQYYTSKARSSEILLMRAFLPTRYVYENFSFSVCFLLFLWFLCRHIFAF